VIGPKTRAAIRKFQKSHGLAADAEESPQLLERMKNVTQQKGLRLPEISAAGN
jgi:peptidoglycan hydrolase-like protein with peptidoglycan-binding domain